MSSKHLDGQIVRDAIISFDNQLLNYETLNSVYDIRPQDDELKLIEVFYFFFFLTQCLNIKNVFLNKRII